MINTPKLLFVTRTGDERLPPAQESLLRSVCQFVQVLTWYIADIRKGESAKQNVFIVSSFRFSNEGDSEDRNETIDWLELKHAVQKKHNLPCKCFIDHVQTSLLATLQSF